MDELKTGYTITESTLQGMWFWDKEGERYFFPHFSVRDNYLDEYVYAMKKYFRPVNKITKELK